MKNSCEHTPVEYFGTPMSRRAFLGSAALSVASLMGCPSTGVQESKPTLVETLSPESVRSQARAYAEKRLEELMTVESLEQLRTSRRRDYFDQPVLDASKDQLATALVQLRMQKSGICERAFAEFEIFQNSRELSSSNAPVTQQSIEVEINTWLVGQIAKVLNDLFRAPPPRPKILRSTTGINNDPAKVLTNHLRERARATAQLSHDQATRDVQRGDVEFRSADFGASK